MTRDSQPFVVPREPASHYDYDLPPHLIADRPAERRDASRLMVVPKSPGEPPRHLHFADLPSLLRPGDLLVLNDSRVLPARLFGKRLPGGGECEILLLEPQAPLSLQPSAFSLQPSSSHWSALARPGKKLRPGTRVRIAEGFDAVIVEDREGGEKLVRFDLAPPAPATLDAALALHGNMPLPPYILARRGEKHSRPEDRDRYQTVYARENGSVAAPTAGLHFTDALLAQLQKQGVEIARVTLHVGAGTFQPITADDIADHRLHSERYTIPAETADAVNRAKSEGRRVIAVGTTAVRTLESAAISKAEDGRLKAEETHKQNPAADPSSSFLQPSAFSLQPSSDPSPITPHPSSSTRLMIAPGYPFRVVDALITNFHLPRSSLLCLVAAMTGRERLLKLYAEAIEKEYRFYSYGDAMFIEGRAQK